MATLIESLKIAASQLQLSSPLGKWAQKMSQVLVSSGSILPQYAFAKRANSTQTITSGSNVSLNISFTRGISYNGTSWILTPGKTYRLTATGWLNNFDQDTSTLSFQWVDDNESPLSTQGIDCPTAIFRPVTNTSKASSAAGLDFIFAVPANATPQQMSVKIRCNGGTGQADIISGAWSAVVQEIPG